MKIEQIGTRGTLFTFSGDDSPMSYPTSVYLIKGHEHLFLCDTHLGPLSMEIVKRYIDENFPNKILVVFNTHSDYDHIWGNCAFTKSPIISHTKCRATMVEKGQGALKDLAHFQHGPVELLLPDLVFDSKLAFADEGIEFFYSPGHTDDSASCYDAVDDVLFVGDSLEIPLPFVSQYRIDDFINTLNLYKKYNAKILLTAHSGIVNEQLVNETITYLEKLSAGEPVQFSDADATDIHEYNLKKILLARYEEMAREALGEKFDFLELNAIFKAKRQESIEELESALKEYLLHGQK